MPAWQVCINRLLREGSCWDAAVVSTAQHKLLAAHQGGVLANLTKAEIQALLGRNRHILLTQGLTLGGLQCLVIRDNLYTHAHQYTMDLRTKLYRDNGDSCTRAITVVLVNSVCLILIGLKGTQGGLLSMKAFELARYIKDNLHQYRGT